jgi:translation elongation factor P/translation initiation factor 5A
LDEFEEVTEDYANLEKLSSYTYNTGTVYLYIDSEQQKAWEINSSRFQGTLDYIEEESDLDTLINELNIF